MPWIQVSAQDVSNKAVDYHSKLNYGLPFQDFFIEDFTCLIKLTLLCFRSLLLLLYTVLSPSNSLLNTQISFFAVTAIWVTCDSDILWTEFIHAWCILYQMKKKLLSSSCVVFSFHLFYYLSKRTTTRWPHCNKMAIVTRDFFSTVYEPVFCNRTKMSK